MTNLRSSPSHAGAALDPGGHEPAPITDEHPRIVWRRIALEDEILSIIVAPAEPGERIETAFRRKEQELIAVFAQLSVLDSMELHRRLRLCLADDPMTTRFTRLTVERRERLMSFLAGARRQEALRRAG